MRRQAAHATATRVLIQQQTLPATLRTPRKPCSSGQGAGAPPKTVQFRTRHERATKNRAIPDTAPNTVQFRTPKCPSGGLGRPELHSYWKSVRNCTVVESTWGCTAARGRPSGAQQPQPSELAASSRHAAADIQDDQRPAATSSRHPCSQRPTVRTASNRGKSLKTTGNRHPR